MGMRRARNVAYNGENQTPLQIDFRDTLWAVAAPKAFQGESAKWRKQE
jgi:hypothetical protein